jgi:nucleoside-diphosphate-sugar epimerase
LDINEKIKKIMGGRGIGLRIQVTGLVGFVGSALTLCLLARGDVVIGVAF